MNTSNLMYLELKKIISSSGKKPGNLIISQINSLKSRFLAKYPNNILARNTFNYILHLDQDINHSFKDSILSRLKEAENHIHNSNDKISLYGQQKIKKGTNIFVYHYTMNLLNILYSANKNGKNFNVFITESRPFFEGRDVAKQLSKLNIPHSLYLDSAARLAIKDADFVLVGADYVSLDSKPYSKIGAELFAEIAHNRGIPFYVCVDSWQMNPHKMEMSSMDMSPDSIWKLAPKSTRINTYIYEKIDPHLITGIISDLGIYKPHIFIEKVIKNSPWLFM